MKSLSRSLSKFSGGKHNAGIKLTLGMVAIFLLASTIRAEWHSDTRPKMGTEVSVYFWHEDERAAAKIIDEVFAEVDRLNALMSTYVETSAISAVNRDASLTAVAAGD